MYNPHLETFLVVAGAGSFNKAAEALFISPPRSLIPFCTSASSGLGESGRLLAEMAGTGTWLEGQRFAEGASQADIQDWVSSLTW